MSKLTTIALTLYGSILSTSHAAEVQVRGIDEELRQTMAALIKPRLEFIGKRTATEWRADDAAFFLRELLIKKGYSQSKVNWELPGNEVIMLKVDLGIRYVIGNVTTVSNDPLSDKLINEYFSEIIPQGSILKREQTPYLEDYPAKGATNIANYLKSLGHWDAQVSVVSINKQPTGMVNIKLNIQRGPMHNILPPAFTGITPEQRIAIQPVIEPYIGKPATSENISSLNNAVHQHYRDQGFQFAKLRVSSQNTSGIQISFNVDTGNLYQVRKITVVGNDRTKTTRFTRYTKSLVGETYRESDANEVAKKLLLTGAFESVRLVPQKINANQLDINLEVTEAKPRFIRAYGGFASYDGLILGSSYTNQNFLNKLQTFSARTEISSRGLLGELSLTEPYFAGVPVSQTTRLYALQRRFDGYKKNQTGLEASFNWEPRSSLTSRLYAGLDYVKLEADGITDEELGPADYLNTKIGFEQTLDLRDSPVLPTEGFHARGLLEYGAISGDASNSYFRTNLNASYRVQLKNESKSRLMFRFNTGAILPSDSNDLPIDLRLFSGGSDSVRSFGERELGPLSASSDPLGGEAYWNASAEYIHPFNDLFSGVLFYDTGNLFADAGDYSFSNPTHSLGIGMRIDLPVGPARFEYGFNLNQKSGEPSGAFHFAIGAQF
ncbi:MAG: BamA/OMP85 family outer membrane protein [Akkermansiaceae bacterium]